MSISLKKNSSKKNGLCVLTVGEDMTIYSASKNHDELSGYFSDYQSFEVDLSAVEEIDSSGIQLLLALKHSAEKGSKQLTLTSVSEPVVEVMSVLNIKDQFNWSGE